MKIKKEKKRKTSFSPAAELLLEASRMDIAMLLRKYNTTLNGYDENTANELRDEYGRNEISRDKPDPIYKKFIAAFINPFTVVLFILALISYFTDVLVANPNEEDFSTVIIICTMVIISGLLRFIQETRSNKSAEKLKTMVKTTVTVARADEGKKEIPSAELVPGDIIFLTAGDMIPADLRVINCKDLFVSQSSLTGESEPVEKFSYPIDQLNKNPLELSNLAFMGSNVVSGTAICMVIATGDHTYFGSLAKTISGKKVVTSFEKGVNSVTWVLIRFMMIMVPIVFFVNGFTKGDWFQAFMFALSVAVGLTPEMLPMIVTTNLAKGAVAMARKKTIVKHLHAIQNFGAMDVLCTDKTGTITKNEVILECYLDIHGNEDKRILRHAFLNSYFQTGLKNLMDMAILSYAKNEPYRSLAEKYTKVDEIPFDFNRRRMSVVIRDKDGKTQLITKGAVEEMLSICSHAEYEGIVVPLNGEIRHEILDTVNNLSNQGMRVLAVAQKNNPPMEEVFSVKDESDMVLIGYLAFLDPPKESAKEAIDALKQYGVNVKVLTGDNEAVAKYICKEVGIKVDNMLLGSDVDGMNDSELAVAVEKVNLFAKLSPQQKSRIVGILRGNGHTVGFLGDGINDAAAMNEADVAISVDTAVDVAKESADIILLEKSLLVLEMGVIEGRRTFGNIIKYIKMTTSSNFGNMFSVVTASAFLPFLPMQPVQIVFLNLIYDISCVAIPWDNMDEDYLKLPRKWDASSIGSFMIWLGPTSSVFDITTYIIMFFIICPYLTGGAYNAGNLNTEHFVSLFNSGWFIESLWSQTLIIHMIRTRKIPFIQSRASKSVLMLTSMAILIGTIVPYTHFGKVLDMSAIPATFFIWLVGTILCYMLLATFMKSMYIRRYGELL
jgi:Mg2+-importing ATPase